MSDRKWAEIPEWVAQARALAHLRILARMFLAPFERIATWLAAYSGKENR